MACGSTDQTGCGSSTCGGYFWSGSACTACSTVADTNNYVLSPPGECICLSGFGWDGSACTACASLTTRNPCVGLSCSSFIWDTANNICSDCSAIANIASNTPLNGGCQCIADYYWNSVESQCLSCSNADEYSCKENCQGFLFKDNSCMTC